MTDNEQHHSQSLDHFDVEISEAGACYEIVSAEHVNEWLIDLLTNERRKSWT